MNQNRAAGIAGLLRRRAWLLGFTCLVSSICPGTRAADGTPLWTNYVHGTSSSNSSPTIVLDTNGNVAVTGTLGFSYTLDWAATAKYLAAGLPQWTNFFNPAVALESAANAVAVDTSGNVYVTGTLYPPKSFNLCATIKYSATGLPVWTNYYQPLFSHGAAGEKIAVDSNGNVIIAGMVAGSSATNFLTIQYSGAGVQLWTANYNGTGYGNDLVEALALDAAGNVIITGSSLGSGGSYNFATLKYSNAGIPLWTNRYQDPQNDGDYPAALAVDDGGNVFVAGYSTNTANGTGYFVTMGYSSAGVALWTNSFNATGTDSGMPKSMAVDSGGSVVVAGYASSNGTNYHYVTLKYSNAGVPLWTNTYHRTATSSDQAAGLALDGSGNVYVTGASTPIGGCSGCATIKYSYEGAPIWTNFFAASVTDSSTGNALAVDSAGDAYLTGSAGIAATQNFFIIKYSGPPPMLDFITTNGDCGFAGNGSQFALLLAGPAGSNAVISVSTNLQTWTPLTTNPLAGGTLMFTDMLATNSLQRFYRASLQ